MLISPEAKGPSKLPGASVVKFGGLPLPRDEVEGYLQSRHGYSPQESGKIYDRIRGELTGEPTPARVYAYINDHCGLRDVS